MKFTKSFFTSEAKCLLECFPEISYRAISFLNSDNFTNYLSTTIFGGKRLYSDPGLNGGGWHIHKKGGKLNTHLDYSLHPKLKLQRKFNIIIYMNPNWKEDWGGALGFWGNESPDKPGELVASIGSKFNRAVIFDTTQNSWHGLPDPLSCPDNEARKSIAVYYLCDPSKDADPRGKVLFSPTKAQEGNEEILDLIEKRSQVDQSSSVYISKSKL